MSLDYTKKTVNGYTYSTNQRIGNGFSSEVYRGSNQKTKQQVAIKVISKVQKKSDDIEMVDREIRYLQALKGSPNILQIKNAIHTKNNIYIVTQFCERGTLADVLAQSRKFSQSQAIDCIRQIINGFKAISQKQLVHRDLKLVNIFITSKDQLKIGDFGFVIDKSLCKQGLLENVGSPLYEAPETLISNKYSTKSDIWAIGIIFIQMLLGRSPWKSSTETELARQLALFKLQNILPSPISKKAKQFLTKCLKRDIQQRMDINQLVQFSFTQERENISKNSVHSQVALKNISLSNFMQLKISVPSLNIRSELKQKCHQNQESTDLIKIPEQSIKLAKNSRPYEISMPRLQKINLESSLEINQQPLNHQQSSKLIRFKGSQVSQTDLTKSQNFVMENEDKLDSPQTENRMKKPLKNDSYSQSLGFQKDKRMMKKGGQRQNVSQTHKKVQSLKESQESKNVSLGTVIAKNTQNRKSTLLQKQILLQCQSQINYFRFLNKLLRKVQDILKTEDQKITLFKKNLLYLIYNKIKTLRQLRGIKQVSPAQLSEFLKTVQYSNLQEVLRQYQERYDQENKKDRIEMVFQSEQQFNNLLIYMMKVLYQNLIKIEQKAEEFNRKKGLVYIIQDLIELVKLHPLDRQENWHTFMSKSAINNIVEKILPSFLDKSYWLEIKKRVLEVGNI